MGTGLDVWICVDMCGYVKDHGGDLEVSDDTSLGRASFELWLHGAGFILGDGVIL